MKDKIQRFGAAMFVPVLLFPPAGMLLGLTVMLLNKDLFPFAQDGTTYVKIVTLLLNVSLVVFKNMPIIFTLGIPIALAKKASGRAVLSSFISFYTFHYFVGGIIGTWSKELGIVYEKGTTGLAEVGGVLSLDTNLLGAIAVASITVWAHNKYFDMELPDWLGVFRGTPLIMIVCFPLMMILAIVTVFTWPSIQNGIQGLQTFMLSSGALGVWLFTFLERLLIPTGLHHFVYGPVFYGPVAVEGGTVNHWIQHIPEYAASAKGLTTLFPQGGLMLTGMGKVFGTTGAALAIYFTAKKNQKKTVLGLLIGATITAILTGITEPIEFTFLFVAPILFLLHALLSATMATITFLVGISGNFQTGLIDFIFQNWLPLFKNHGIMYLLQIVIGLSFTGIYFFLFKHLIIKMNLATPGRSDEEVKLHSKSEYRNSKKSNGESKDLLKAKSFLEGLGGSDNIEAVTNCATRLRVKVKNPEKVKETSYFQSAGATNLVAAGNNYQIIVGLSVPQVREELEGLLNK